MSKETYQLNQDFLWGGAIAAHQAEGAWQGRLAERVLVSLTC